MRTQTNRLFDIEIQARGEDSIEYKDEYEGSVKHLAE